MTLLQINTRRLDCPPSGRLDIYGHVPRNPSDFAQTIFLCENRVVDIRHSR